MSIADFQRFLLAWQRVDPEDRAQGPEGVRAVLETLDGCELAAAAWEPEVLALPRERLCPALARPALLHRANRLGQAHPAANTDRPVARPDSFEPDRRSLPARTCSIGWRCRLRRFAPDLSPDARKCFECLSSAGRCSSARLSRPRSLLPSRVEQALAELAAQGWVTADSFEGLRALLLPEEKRAPFADSRRRRHHKSVTSVEFGGRWSLLRKMFPLASEAGPLANTETDESVEALARSPAPAVRRGLATYSGKGILARFLVRLHTRFSTA